MKKYAIYANNDKKSLKIAEAFKKECKLPYDAIKPDYLLVVGGDGTVLKATKEYSHIIDSVVFFAINTGHLGYYTNYHTSQINVIIEQMESNCFQTEKHVLLKYSLFTNNEEHKGYALNEVTLINSPKVLVLDVFIDDFFLEKMRGTGVCISTPTGSTAYNKSLGGAVVDYDLPSLQIAEIASINSNAYRTIGSPLIVSSLRTITVLPNIHNECIFTFDNSSVVCSDFDKLEIQLSDKYAVFACCAPIHFLTRVQKGFL